MSNNQSDVTSDPCVALYAAREAIFGALEALGLNGSNSPAADELVDREEHLAIAISFMAPTTTAGAEVCRMLFDYFDDLAECQGDSEDRAYLRGLYARAAARCRATAARYAAEKAAQADRDADRAT